MEYLIYAHTVVTIFLLFYCLTLDKNGTRSSERLDMMEMRYEHHNAIISQVMNKALADIKELQRKAPK